MDASSCIAHLRETLGVVPMTEGLIDRFAQMAEDEEQATPGKELSPDLYKAFGQVVRNSQLRKGIADNLSRAAPALSLLKSPITVPRAIVVRWEPVFAVGDFSSQPTMVDKKSKTVKQPIIRKEGFIKSPGEDLMNATRLV